MPADRQKDGAGATPPPVAAPGWGSAWNRGVDGLAALGTIMIVALMVMIVADVVVRNLVGASLPLIAELGALTVVLIVFLQLGTTVRNDRLANADFFLEFVGARRPAVAAGVRAVWDLLGAAVCTGIAWSSWGILRRDFEHREFIGVTGVLTMPTSPFRALIFLGAAVAAVQFVLIALRRLRSIAKEDGSR
ncbi:MAG: TRAP transporter small permease subunit [Rhizobiaceae bacterium]